MRRCSSRPTQPHALHAEVGGGDPVARTQRQAADGTVQSALETIQSTPSTEARIRHTPIANRGSTQNDRGMRCGHCCRVFAGHRRSPSVSGLKPVVISMVAARALRSPKPCPAAPFCRPRLTHNRGMNDTESAGTLARFLTLADTAEVLNVSASQAYALVRSGELPAIKVGGRGQWRVERSVLESYIQAKYEESGGSASGTSSTWAASPSCSADGVVTAAPTITAVPAGADPAESFGTRTRRSPAGRRPIVNGEVEVVPTDPVDGAVQVAVGKVHAHLAAATAQIPQHERQARLVIPGSASRGDGGFRLCCTCGGVRMTAMAGNGSTHWACRAESSRRSADSQSLPMATGRSDRLRPPRSVKRMP